MSHNCGRVETVSPNIQIGPDGPTPPTSADTWQHDFSYLSGGTKFIILHFLNVSLPASNRLEVDLGYGTDVFTAADGGSFWTRPINVGALPGGTVPIRYVTNGSNSGSASVDLYGRGLSSQSFSSGHDSITNCDPFIPGNWVEPHFPHIPGSTAPKYDPYWICNGAAAPRWDNARCSADGTLQRQVSRSVGMILGIHEGSPAHPDPYVSTCSVTLIDSDLVALAGHCISDHPFSVPTSSVTFDYEVQCDGTRVPAYNAVFYKVIRLVKYRFEGVRDYAVLQIRGAPPLPPIPVRNGVPAVGEAVFGVHHPNGAVKKITPPGTTTVPVLSTGSNVRVNMDVAGGSSGSGLFDTSGRLVGVLSSGGPCNIGYSSSELMLNDPIDVPDPPTERAVMLVMDRSGSMSEPAQGGGVKMDEARDAASLFLSLMRTGTDNAAGLVTFSSNASSPIEYPLTPLTAPVRGDLLNELPGITPGGRTSIGDGLAAARAQLDMSADGRPRAMLVLTDGMENEPLAIADVAGLSGNAITAIGFGTESNLDGQRLTDLAQTHGGFYKRAGSGLELRKFFALAFGDIFEAGALDDPDRHLPRDQLEGPWAPFDVCGEEAVTVVIGWDNPNAPLLLQVRAPSGQVLDMNAGGIENDDGAGWRFARIPLPQNGERDGTWAVRVTRLGKGSVEFPQSGPATNYFVTIIARGGPSLRPFRQPRRLYTGDVLTPQVILQYPDETVPAGGEATLSLRRPDASVGNLLAKNGLGAARMVDGDVIPARQATLSELETNSGAPVTNYVEETHGMQMGGAATGSFAHSGVFGLRLTDALVVEGTYTFHARAVLKKGDCRLTREVQWSHHVHVGIDPDATDVTVTSVQGGGGGSVVTFTPKDRYGNLVGPGAGDGFDVAPLPGCALIGSLVDLGDGRYRQRIDCGPDRDDPPGLVITQPERDPKVLVPPTRRRSIHRYVITFHCGETTLCGCDCAPLLPGRYASSASLVNLGRRPATIVLSVIPTALLGTRMGAWPDAAQVTARDRTQIEPQSATVIDCCTLAQLLLKAVPAGTQPAMAASLLVESSEALDVTATYTMISAEGGVSIDVERVPGTQDEVVEATERPSPPPRAAAPSPPPPYRFQDVKRRRPQKDEKKDDKRDDKPKPGRKSSSKS